MAHPKQPNSTQFTRRQALMALVGSVALPGCGGGGSVAGLSSGGTGSFTNGVIIGLGSIIVNGIRYDDSTASVNGGAGTSSQLKLGMVVSVQGSSVTPAAVIGGLATATATSVSYESEWKGPLEFSPVSNSFVMLGQTVQVLSTTVFDGTTLSGLAVGDIVEVYGFVDPGTNTLQASRVEVMTSQPSRFQLSGAISNLTSSTFKLGNTTVNFATTQDKPNTLQNGMLVRVELETTRNSDNQWVATRVRAVNAISNISLDEDDVAEIEGTITTYSSPTAFSVNGIPIDASLAERPSSGLVLGARVKVEGSVVNSAIRASKVELEDEAAIEAREFEFHDRVASLDTTAKTFSVKGYTVYYADNQLPSNTTWVNGLDVEVKARLDANGRLVATKIEADSED